MLISNPLKNENIPIFIIVSKNSILLGSISGLGGSILSKEVKIVVPYWTHSNSD
jgi:hypothetical protein